jgi:LacI family transcriptional regulator
MWWVKEAGLRVPEDTGVVHLSKDGDVGNWAGIHSYKRELGAMAAEWVIAQVQNRRFGIPKVSFDTIVRGSWHEGWTLLTPKPRKGKN